MEIKITKRSCFRTVANDMCLMWYYQVNGRMTEGNRMRKFSFIFSMDYFDVADYYDLDRVTEKDRLNYLNDFIDFYTGNIRSFDDCQAFLDLCRKSYEDYNSSLS